MPETSSGKALLPCHRCDALVDAYDAQAVTVDYAGTYARWTHGRAAYYARNANRTVPFLKYLCQTCDHEVFTSAAQTDVADPARPHRTREWDS